MRLFCVRSSWRSAPSTDTVPCARAPAGRHASSGWNAGWASASNVISRPKTSLAKSITASRRAEVGRQRNTVGADLIGRAQVLGDVGSSEAVDRLLGITDDEQTTRERPQPPPGRSTVVDRGLIGIVGVGGEADGDLELDRIGVLELVEEHALVPFVQDAADVRTVGQQATGEHEQVVELEQAGLGASCRRIEDEAPHHRPEQESPVSTDAFEEFVRHSTEFDLEALQRFEIGRAVRPERLRPLSLRSRPPLAVAPVAVAAIEFDDQLQSDSYAVGRRQFVDECGDLTGGLDLLVVGRHRTGGDLRADGEQGSDIEVQRSRIREVDAVDDEVPVRPEVVGHSAGTLVDAAAVELAQLHECPAAIDHPAGRDPVRRAGGRAGRPTAPRMPASSRVRPARRTRAAGRPRSGSRTASAGRTSAGSRSAHGRADRARHGLQGSGRVRGRRGCGCAVRRRPSR